MIGYGIRLIWKKAIIKWGNSGTKATMILVAEEQKVGEIISRLKDTDYYEYVGIVLSNRNGTGEELFGVKVVASLETAADYICRSWVDEVFVYPASLSGMELSAYESIEKFMEDSFDVFTGNNYAEYYEKEKEDKQQIKIEGVSNLISACREMSIPVHICLPIIKNSGKSLIQKVGGYNVLTKTSNYASPLQLAMKRMIDIIGGIAGSLIAIVIIAVTGHMIKKESPGPILFKQTRIGLNGKKFQVYKIRTMYMDTEEKKKELLDHNRVSDGLMFKLDWDPRVIGNRIIDGKQVTGIGEKLRSGSWDEWPQFFNVLIGQMSLVGTRPPTVDEWEKYKYHHRARMSMKPGITGMWQVSGRSKITDFEEVVKLDTEYINHWSIGLDFRILAKTIQVVLKKEGAL